MANHEDRTIKDKVHLLLAFKRKKLGNDENKCFRVVVKDYDLDLFFLKEKCKKLGGIWRIHHTVNARDTEKARKWLIHKLIDNPQFAGCVDSIWRTALLQEECKAENNFMFDVDNLNDEIVGKIWMLTQPFLIKNIRTPNGRHYITKPFDCREILTLPNISLIKDGYYFVEEINCENNP